MSDEITFSGKTYVSSKRASKISGYAQDYIGQLARSGQIEAQRVGGLWYISMESLLGYRKEPVVTDAVTSQLASEEQVSVPLTASEDVESFISFDGKDYISAARASKLTGYNQDYVGQLARSGQILARQISNRWYVDREGIIKHKSDKDALLAAVQAESVGLQHAQPVQTPVEAARVSPPQFAYFEDDSDLMPLPKRSEDVSEPSIPRLYEPPPLANAIPIRLVKQSPPAQNVMERAAKFDPPRGAMLSGFRGTGALVAAALTVVIVISFGIVGLKSNSTYVLRDLRPPEAFTASAANLLDRFGSQLEQYLSPELHFVR